MRRSGARPPWPLTGLRGLCRACHTEVLMQECPIRSPAMKTGLHAQAHSARKSEYHLTKKAPAMSAAEASPSHLEVGIVFYRLRRGAASSAELAASRINEPGSGVAEKLRSSMDNP